jgi:hypothetical protein
MDSKPVLKLRIGQIALGTYDVCGKLRGLNRALAAPPVVQDRL